MDFEQAFARLLAPEREGAGFSNHPDDPGGATRYGVTEAVARRFGYRGDMRALPLETAREIYRQLYWTPVRADELPPELRFDVFDAAVNSGVTQAALWLQRAVGAAADGRIGPATLAAAWACRPGSAQARFNGHRLRAMTDFPGWPSFGRGWARRIAANLVELG